MSCRLFSRSLIFFEIYKMKRFLIVVILFMFGLLSFFCKNDGNNNENLLNLLLIESDGVAGPGNGQFEGPDGIAVDSSGDVHVTDIENNQVQEFTSSGVYITQWGSYGSDNGQFSYPAGIAVDSSGNVYVVDYYNDRVQEFTSSGVYITQWGSYGSDNGQFSYPWA